MGRDTVTPSKATIAFIRKGIYTQLGGTKLVRVHGSLANAIEVLGLQDFIENQVQCRAADAAWISSYEEMLKLEHTTEREEDK